MKKIFSSLIVAVFAMAIMAGGAWASELDIAAADGNVVDVDTDALASGPYVVGSEWLAGQAGVLVDLGNAIPTPGAATADRSDIYYVPTIDIGRNSSIVITVTNGGIAPNTGYGLYDDVGIIAPAQVANLIDVTWINGNYETMTFKFNRLVEAGTVLAMTEDGAAPVATNRPVLSFTAAQLAAGNMTLQVTNAYDDTSLPLEVPLTEPEIVAKRAVQLSAKVQYVSGVYTDGNATSVIDVEATPSRAEFVVEADLDTPTVTTSTAAILVVNATVNNGIVVADAAYTITLNGNQTAIQNVSLEGTAFTEATDSWSLTSNFGVNDLIIPGVNDITITVDGTTIIDIAAYTVDLVIDPLEIGVADQQKLDDATAFVWTINAMQAKVPYLQINNPNFLAFMKIANEGGYDAELTVDAIIWNYTDDINNPENAVVQQGVPVKTIPGNSITTVSEADLMTALALDDTKIYHVELTLTVAAQQNTIHISAFQKDNVGRTAVPVLYNTNNTGGMSVSGTFNVGPFSGGTFTGTGNAGGDGRLWQ